MKNSSIKIRGISKIIDGAPNGIFYYKIGSNDDMFDFIPSNCENNEDCVEF